jgi:hypothetical protein
MTMAGVAKEIAPTANACSPATWSNRFADVRGALLGSAAMSELSPKCAQKRICAGARYADIKLIHGDSGRTAARAPPRNQERDEDQAGHRRAQCQAKVVAFC